MIGLVVRELIPVAGVFLAGWNVLVVGYLFWYETFIIFCFYMVYALTAFAINLDAVARTKPKLSAYKFSATGIVMLLVASIMYNFLGALPGFIAITSLYMNTHGTASQVAPFLHPLIMFSRTLAVIREYHIGLAIIALVTIYMVEIITHARAAMKMGQDSSDQSFMVRLLNKGMDRVDSIYQFRFAKLFLLSFLIVIAGFAIQYTGDTLELGRWSFVAIIILKIVFDISNLDREQTVAVEPVRSEFDGQQGQQTNSHVFRTNRGQVWQPNRKIK